MIVEIPMWLIIMAIIGLILIIIYQSKQIEKLSMGIMEQSALNLSLAVILQEINRKYEDVKELSVPSEYKDLLEFLGQTSKCVTQNNKIGGTTK